MVHKSVLLSARPSDVTFGMGAGPTESDDDDDGGGHLLPKQRAKRSKCLKTVASLTE